MILFDLFWKFKVIIHNGDIQYANEWEHIT